MQPTTTPRLQREDRRVLMRSAIIAQQVADMLHDLTERLISQCDQEEPDAKDNPSVPDR